MEVTGFVSVDVAEGVEEDLVDVEDVLLRVDDSE